MDEQPEKYNLNGTIQLLAVKDAGNTGAGSSKPAGFELGATVLPTSK